MRHTATRHDWAPLARQLNSQLPGKMGVPEMAYLGELVCMAPPGRLVDLGTYWGRSAMMMALAWRHDRRGIDRQVLSIDNYCEGPNAKAGGGPYPDIWTNQRSFAGLPDVHLHFGLTDDPPLIVCDRPVALVLVDGSHDKLSVEDDIRAWADLVADMGIMAFDDYGNDRWPDVKAVVDRQMTNGWERLGQRGSLIAFRKGGANGN
jgi:hypothetical protein